MVTPNKNLSTRSPVAALGTVYVLLILLAQVSASPFQGNRAVSGHKQDFRLVAEGLKSQRISALHKSISEGVDEKFPNMVKREFPKVSPGKNHRYLGHWGFQGSIPFNTPPYDNALSVYSRPKLAGVWRRFCNELTQEAMVATGLPERQSRAYVGLHYNMHLLGDWGPGNKVLEPLPSPNHVIKDIKKNLNRLFGNRSRLAAEVADELMGISMENPQRFSVLARRVLAKHPVGRKLWDNYGDNLRKAGLHYRPKDEGRAFTELIRKTANQLDDDVVPERWLDEMVGRRSPRGAALAEDVRLRARTGFLQKLKTGRQTVLALSIPIDAELALQLGMEAGVCTFFLTESLAVYKYASGHITQDRFIIETTRNLADSLAAGSAVYIAVALGVCPQGWGLLAIGVGGAVIADITFDSIAERFRDETFSLEDFIGRLPTAVQNRKRA